MFLDFGLFIQVLVEVESAKGHNREDGIKAAAC